ncbi:MAG: mechanosensitive ion channel family protein [Bacilli bacterium]|nr:mechanosensitive ion channel family protein [Bacilli bacterium]
MIKAFKNWWHNKNEKERKGKILGVIVHAVMIVIAIVIGILSGFMPFFKDAINAFGPLSPDMNVIGPKIVGSIFYLSIIIGGSYFLRGLIFLLFLPTNNKVQTIVKLIISTLKYGFGLTFIFVELSLWGVPVMTQLAAAGILALIIGLGAQSIISDILAGINIVFENEFGVGDTVLIDGFRGDIQEIGLTMTKIIDFSGNVKTINNSKISTVINLSASASVVAVDIGIEYGEDLRKVEQLVADNVAGIKERNPQMLTQPVYAGVAALSDSAVVLKFLVRCEEPNRFVVERALNRELYLLFNENGINIPFPQVTISNRQEPQK